MKQLYRSLGAALVGAVIVLAATWLSESVLSLPLQTYALTILLVLFVAGAVLSGRGRIRDAAPLVAGSGVAWALHAVSPLRLCQSDLLFRPCTLSEVAWIMLPAVVLLVAGSILLGSATTRARRSH